WSPRRGRPVVGSLPVAQAGQVEEAGPGLHADSNPVTLEEPLIPQGFEEPVYASPYGRPPKALLKATVSRRRSDRQPHGGSEAPGDAPRLRLQPREAGAQK
ncbi:MAG: hypothetical protein QW587_11340, partial [Candidatus Bathyarchaeia archaeon]